MMKQILSGVFRRLPASSLRSFFLLALLGACGLPPSAQAADAAHASPADAHTAPTLPRIWNGGDSAPSRIWNDGDSAPARIWNGGDSAPSRDAAPGGSSKRPEVRIHAATERAAFPGKTENGNPAAPNRTLAPSAPTPVDAASLSALPRKLPPAPPRASESLPPSGASPARPDASLALSGTSPATPKISPAAFGIFSSLSGASPAASGASPSLSGASPAASGASPAPMLLLTPPNAASTLLPASLETGFSALNAPSASVVSVTPPPGWNEPAADTLDLILEEALAHARKTAKEETERASEKAANAPPWQRLYPDLMTLPLCPNAVYPPGAIYLTFDDGPTPAITEQVLELLRAEGATATFFVTAQHKGTRELLQHIAADGHTMGMHTYSHNYRDIYSSVEAYLNDFKLIHDMVLEVNGEAAIFRFPGGSDKPKAVIRKEMERRGFVWFDWNIDSEDAVAGSTARQICDSVIHQLGMKHASSPKIVLMHDTKRKTVEALRMLLPYLRAQGYTFAALTPDLPPVQFRRAAPGPCVAQESNVW